MFGLMEKAIEVFLKKIRNPRTRFDPKTAKINASPFPPLLSYFFYKLINIIFYKIKQIHISLFNLILLH